MDLTAITFGKDVENGYGFIEWQPQDGVLLTAIKLDGSGERRTFRAPTHFCYHFSNCFESEDGKDIIFDASVYEVWLMAWPSDHRGLLFVPVTPCIAGDACLLHILFSTDCRDCGALLQHERLRA